MSDIKERLRASAYPLSMRQMETNEDGIPTIPGDPEGLTAAETMTEAADHIAALEAKIDGALKWGNTRGDRGGSCPLCATRDPNTLMTEPGIDDRTGKISSPPPADRISEEDKAKAIAELSAKLKNEVPVYQQLAVAKDRITALEAEVERLRVALGDLISWFPDNPSSPEWRLKAGEYGADDAVQAAREALKDAS